MLARQMFPLDADDIRALALEDRDGDGDLDLYVGNRTQDRLVLNDGTGVFADAASTNLPLVSGYTNAVALGDVDGDGDLDVFVANDSGYVGSAVAFHRGPPSLVLVNATRGLVRRAIPRVGKPHTFDIYGPAWGTWFLGFAMGTANQPIPPLGVLRLDPATVYTVSASLLDDRGRASITFPVPADPSLVGASLFWQAVVAGPARFTNLKVTTLTTL